MFQGRKPYRRIALGSVTVYGYMKYRQAMLATLLSLGWGMAGTGCQHASEQPARPASAPHFIATSLLPGKSHAVRLTYGGRWEAVHIADGRYDGASMRSHVRGAIAIAQFDGDRVRLYGVRGPNGGRAVVTIDTAYADTQIVSFYAPFKIAHALVYDSPALRPGHHMLAVGVYSGAGQRLRGYVNIDSIAIAH